MDEQVAVAEAPQRKKRKQAAKVQPILPDVEVEVPMPPVKPAVEAAPEPPPLPKVTTAAEWKRKARAAYLITLRSGVILKVRRKDVQKMAAEGIISVDDLYHVSQTDTFPQMPELPDDATDEQKKDAEKERMKMTMMVLAERAKAMLPVARAVAPHIVIEPEIVLANAGDNQMLLDEIPENDLNQLLLWALGQGLAILAERECEE